MSPEELRLRCVELAIQGNPFDPIKRASEVEVYVTDADGRARRLARDLRDLTNYVERRLAYLAKHGPSDGPDIRDFIDPVQAFAQPQESAQSATGTSGASDENRA